MPRTAQAGPLDIYCIAIGGTGMAPLACLLRDAGHRVRGSDGPLYPPMSTLLEAAGIPVLEGWDPQHLEPRPDLVVVGNAVPRDNPEARAAERLGLDRCSLPQALARFFLARRRPLVVAGTHGKTTTTSMAAWVYARCGKDPGYLIGGVPRGLPASFARGSGPRFIIEGDEYNAAYFDRGPKFLHYRPQALILTSAEYDHADLYPSLSTLLDAYRELVALVPEDGFIAACGDDPAVLEVVRSARAPVVTYGFDAAAALHPLGTVDADPQGSRIELYDPEIGKVSLALPVAGRHNLLNAMAVWLAARADGLEAPAVLDALASFPGVARRMEARATGAGVILVDDFAHHPTAVASTLDALRQLYPGRRLVVLYEPRSLTAGRQIFFDAYRRAFGEADRVLIAPVFHAARLADAERLDLEALAACLEREGVTVTSYDSIEALYEAALLELRPGDVAVTMSSGAFGGLPRRLQDALQSSSGAG